MNTDLLDWAGLVATDTPRRGRRSEQFLDYDERNKRRVKNLLVKMPLVHMARCRAYSQYVVGSMQFDTGYESRPIKQIKKTGFVSFDYEKYCNSESRPARLTRSTLPVVLKPCKVFAVPLDLEELLNQKITPATRKYILSLRKKTPEEDIDYIVIDDSDEEKTVIAEPVKTVEPVPVLSTKRPVVFLEPLEKTQLAVMMTPSRRNGLIANYFPTTPTTKIANEVINGEVTPRSSRRRRVRESTSPSTNLSNGIVDNIKRRCIMTPSSTTGPSITSNYCTPSRRPALTRAKKTKAIIRIKSATTYDNELAVRSKSQ